MNLDAKISVLPLVGHVYDLRLKKLGLETLGDLLYHVPRKYLDFSQISKVAQASVGETITLKGKMVSLKNIYTKRGLRMQIGGVEDESGKLTIVWFNQPFLIKSLYPGRIVSLSGKVDFFGKQKALISPEYEIVGESAETVHTGRLVPIYPETYGVSSKWLRGKIKKALLVTKDSLEDLLPKPLLQENNFPGLFEALMSVHFPKTLSFAQNARRRLAFEEFLNLQLKSLFRKDSWHKNRATYKLKINRSTIRGFINSLPFTLTNSQKVVVRELLSDLSRDYPMNRLLEGDVGSGKTIVAAIACFAAFSNGLQSVIMAPTQILAEQHANTLSKLFKIYKIRISLVTSTVKKADIGRADIFIGTHALIHDKIDFDKVGLVVIDEQHRFGVEQRLHLAKKSSGKTLAPHILTMTATPIPRTIALSAYGDLDLSTLKELPRGRQKITTWIVPPDKRKAAFEWIDSQVKNNHSQAFVICPLIEESEKIGMQEVKAVAAEAKELAKILKNSRQDMLHGRLAAKEKNKVLSKFKKGETDVLISTPVVEVGIDIPNASIMAIEEAERFGLAQLHQLRGRVGRGETKSYCLLFAKRPTRRITAMTKDLSGFELAELDLKLRGPGEVFGKRQHGFVDLKIASWSDDDLIKKAKKVADDVFCNPKKYPKLAKKIDTFLHVA